VNITASGTVIDCPVWAASAQLASIESFLQSGKGFTSAVVIGVADWGCHVC
jgi:hypothetical protein